MIIVLSFFLKILPFTYSFYSSMPMLPISLNMTLRLECFLQMLDWLVKAHVIVQYFSFGYPKLPILDKNFSGFGCGKFQMCPKVVLEMVKKQNNCDICKNIRIQIVIPNFLNFVTYFCITLLDESEFSRFPFSKIYFQNIRFLTKIKKFDRIFWRWHAP